MTKAKVPFLSFGYVPTELQAPREKQCSEASQDSLYSSRPLGPTLHRLYSLRPQTLAFSLCDSPVGLLAALLDVIHTRAPSQSPLTSRSRSPFLSPVELERQDADHEPSEQDRIYSGSTARPQYPFSPLQSEMDARNYTWSPTEVLNFTMLQWLPGPEAVRNPKAHGRSLSWPLQKMLAKLFCHKHCLRVMRHTQERFWPSCCTPAFLDHQVRLLTVPLSYRHSAGCAAHTSNQLICSGVDTVLSLSASVLSTHAIVVE